MFCLFVFMSLLHFVIDEKSPFFGFKNPKHSLLDPMVSLISASSFLWLILLFKEVAKESGNVEGILFVFFNHILAFNASFLIFYSSFMNVFILNVKFVISSNLVISALSFC